jgi:hypothetical protein
MGAADQGPVWARQTLRAEVALESCESGRRLRRERPAFHFPV